ncbi:cysteine desulfurase [Halovulum dunhuangense]|uniref:Cysteine desulfurase n=1 Tax=Halovulum dunhuangense TaxID=1505036 RepID=A0A849L3L5_9RHOB|nr:cysteine desulfurase family protein [Halovulum dunhuangense]NNU80751.1 cysteine desulfurase [Halovulum dunhuangense]
MSRVYLDFNATAPLRPEARAAMLAAMDLVGNPSSVHAEGRAARAVIEQARAQVAAAVGCDRDEVIFTSGATEAAALALSGRDRIAALATEHDAVFSHLGDGEALPVDAEGRLHGTLPGDAFTCVQVANSETGVLQGATGDLADAVQAVGKLPYAFGWSGARAAMVSAHKLGGPKGVGALLLKSGQEISARITGGGQEMGRRSGTENVIGIAGFGAACEAAQRDLESGAWDRVAGLRNILEELLEAGAADIIFAGRGAERLPNTSCFAVPGWKGETQVMQMDLAGFAVSAGSACSSGKVKESRVLRAMGLDAETASSAIRVSLGPQTTEAELRSFAEAWLAARSRRRARAA